MSERLMLPEKPTGNTPQAADALAMLRRVADQHGNFEHLERNANKAKHELLATIFEESLRYEGDPDAKAALVAEVNRLPEVQARKRWEATLELDSADIILVTILGIGPTKSTKSQWLKAIIKGRADATDRKGFLKWLEKKGGIIEAGKDESNADKPSDNDSNEPPLAEPTAVERLLKELPAMSDAAPPIALKDDAARDGQLIAVLLTPTTDERGAPTGEMRVLKKSHDEKLLELFAKLALPRRRERSEKEVRRLTGKMLERLNRTVIKQETNRGGPMRSSDYITFRRALKALSQVDRDKKFFTEAPIVSAEIFDRKAKFGKGGRVSCARLNPINLDFHPLDPGRYIDGAKKDVLLDYELSGPTVEECRDDFEGYLGKISKRRSRVPETDDYPTLDPFISKTNVADVQEGPVHA